jgi:1,4-dihydroxy-2-naphthoyl-CoA hydrolase
MSENIWKVPVDLALLNQRSISTLTEHLNIVFTEVDPHSLSATMPVDFRTIQPSGILNGGATAALAETVASTAANFCIDPKTHFCVGLDLNINHLKQVQTGKVKAIAKPFHLGKTTQVWEIKVYNEEKKLISIARMTMAVLKKNPSS